MLSLAKDLQTSKYTLEEFGEVALRILNYLPNVLSDFKDKNQYRLYSSEIAGTKKHARPINQKLFVSDLNEFKDNYNIVKSIFNKIRCTY